MTIRKANEPKKVILIRGPGLGGVICKRQIQIRADLNLCLDSEGGFLAPPIGLDLLSRPLKPKAREAAASAFREIILIQSSRGGLGSLRDR